MYISPPPRNPLGQLLAAVFGVLAMVGAFVFGLVALAVVAGLAALVGILVWFQSWRIRRQMSAANPAPDRRTHGETIDAEYTVISRQNDNH